MPEVPAKGVRSSIDHNDWDRPENIWSADRSCGTYYGGFTSWWVGFHRDVWRLFGCNADVAFFKRLLGPQTTTATFSHRNWIWHRPDEDWLLYVSRRGPVLEVHRDLDADGAWRAFERFRDRVYRAMSSLEGREDAPEGNIGPCRMKGTPP
jgi:hypothetical protein